MTVLPNMIDASSKEKRRGPGVTENLLSMTFSVSHLILTKNAMRQVCLFHFIDEETEAQDVKQLSRSNITGKRQRLGLIPSVP